MKKRTAGFSLIELMFVVAVIAVIMAIAIPSYSRYVVKGKRAEGRGAVLQAAQRMERYFTVNNTYTSTISAAGIGQYSGQDNSAANSAYAISVSPGAAGIATSFIIRATPQGTFSDPECGIFTYDQNGTKGMESATETSVAKCWQ